MPAGKSDNPSKPKNGAANPPVGQLEEVSIDQIEPNPRNPRQTFKPTTIEQLAASLEDIGLQVPITVYKSEQKSGHKYILLDGERRFRAARLINWDKIPALVVKRPSTNDNAIRMFNIHMLREEWEEIETAWALEQIMEETGETKIRNLQRITGLTQDRIRNMLRVLEFPKAQQQKVADGELSYQLLVELDKNVLSRRRKEKKAADDKPITNLSPAQLRDVFLKKYENNIESDIVDLRHVGTLWDTAKSEGKVGSRAKEALVTLIEKHDATIEDAFEIGAAASVGLQKIMRDINALPSRLDDFVESGLHSEHRGELKAALRDLIKELTRISKGI
ncbi:MAG: ParB/RepB/Spo0J family partition protein [Parasphingopyxis sp.]|uniref:ParB/RepB/Spo0J family partition protein n=1 Tax=Parasphingopyxis sp. TaxID=1920299 RepID=UPI003FA0ABDC